MAVTPKFPGPSEHLPACFLVSLLRAGSLFGEMVKCESVKLAPQTATGAFFMHRPLVAQQIFEKASPG
jgi:hypothetical protein